MFFMRLRRSAKPVFIVLALVFALSFVFLGVGSGSSGIGDLLRGNFSFFGGGSGTGGPSADKARERIKKNPNDAQAYRDLATALQTKGEVDEAITALNRYTELRPKDVDALRELAALELRRADDFQNQANEAQVSAQAALASSTFAPDPSSKIGQALQDPIVQAITAKTNAAVTDAYTKAQASYKEALAAYKQIAALSPKDPTTQLELAQAAEAASDATTAIAAYQAFLKLAPDDPSAPQVKQRIKQLQTPQPSAGSTG